MHRVSCLVCLMQKLGKAYHTDARPATEGGAGGRVVKNLLNARVTEENGQGKRGETRLQVELVNIRTPFFERFVLMACSMRQASFSACSSGMPSALVRNVNSM